MRSGKTIAMAALVGLTLVGGGSIGLATIGSSMADAQNNQQTRFHATAHCNDGTWSWTKTPDAADACAHHGGVAL